MCLHTMGLLIQKGKRNRENKLKLKWRNYTITARQNKKKIACIFNYAPHYRHSIYHMMAKEFGCDFYFGANLPNGQKLKKMDFKALPGFKKESKLFKFRYEWQCNVVIQAFKGYKIYILTGHPTLSNIALMAFAKLFNKKVFLWTHGFKKLEEGKHPLLRFFFKNAEYFLYGNYGKKMMAEYGIPEDRLHVIYNSLDYDRQLEVRKKLTSKTLYAERFKNNDPVVIFSGRLLENKKIEMVMDVQKKLASTCPFNLVLVGDGPQQSQLEQTAQQLDLGDRVWFYGPCYDEDTLGDLFYNAALTVSPGNIGLTAIHSMSYGTPVLTHDNFVTQMPEFETVIPGKTGLLFKEDDIEDLASNIKNWFTNFSDRELVRQNCFSVIDDHYNPYFSLSVIKKALANL